MRSRKLSHERTSTSKKTMPPIRRYLRITQHSVLECRIYLDNPADAYRWLLRSRDPLLPHVIEAVRPLVLPKLREENARANNSKAGGKGGGGGGGGGKRKAWKDVVVRGMYVCMLAAASFFSFSFFLRVRKRIVGEILGRKWRKLFRQQGADYGLCVGQMISKSPSS